MEQQTVYAIREKSCAQDNAGHPPASRHEEMLVCPPAAPHSHPGGPDSLFIAFCFQPAAISTHPLTFKCSLHRGTQAASTVNFLLKKSCIYDALSLPPYLLLLLPLLCIISYPLAASAASLVTTAESTALGIPQHRLATPSLPTRDLFGTSLPPTSAQEPAQEGKLGRSSLTTGRGRRPMLLPGSLVPTAWL